MSSSNTFLRYFRRVGAGSLAISIALHVALLITATVYVVSTVQEERKLAFQGGSGPASAGPAAQEHRVQVARNQATLSNVNKRLSVDSPNAAVSVPDLPDLPGLSTLGAGPVGPRGSLGGSGGGAGQGVGSALGPIMPSFGFRDPQAGGTLLGRFYDLKQFADGKPNPDVGKLGTNNLASSETAAFVRANFDTSRLERFFRAPDPLYATQIFIPVIPATEAPKAYEVEKKVRPEAWLAHYRGRISPPASGNYRFVGYGDDNLIVRLDGRVVLDASIGNITGFKSDRTKNATYPYEFQNTNTSRGGFVVGRPMDLRAGQYYNLDIVISEGPGGSFAAMILFEQAGVTYAKDAKGNPILPIFRVAGIRTETSKSAPPFVADGPVWLALPPPR